MPRTFPIPASTALPPLRALRAFEAAARTLSFSHAAAELHVTHGAVSRQVAALEEHLAHRLFERTSRGLRLTPQGATLHREVTAAFDQIRRAAGRLSGAATDWQIRVSVPPTFALRWLIPRMPQVQRALPRLKLELSMSIERPRFEAGDPDAAIRRVHASPRGVETTRFLDGRSVPVCSAEYARSQRLARPRDLLRANLIVVDIEPQVWPEWLAERGLKWAPTREQPRFEQIYYAVQAAVASLGVALVPLGLVQHEIDEGHLVMPFPPEKTRGPDYALLHPRASARREALDAFAGWLKQAGGRERAASIAG